MLKSKYQNNSKKPLNRLFLAISNNWKEIALLVILIPIAYRYYKDQQQKNQVQTQNLADKTTKTQNKKYNPTIQLSKIDKALKYYKFKDKAQRDKIIASAKMLPYHLGTQFFFENDYVELSLNHKSWTENDDEVEKILLANPVNYPILEKLYFEVFTPQRNLTADILKYLDSSNLKTVRAQYKKYNKFWLN